MLYIIIDISYDIGRVQSYRIDTPLIGAYKYVIRLVTDQIVDDDDVMQLDYRVVYAHK